MSVITDEIISLCATCMQAKHTTVYIQQLRCGSAVQSIQDSTCMHACMQQTICVCPPVPYPVLRTSGRVHFLASVRERYARGNFIAPRCRVAGRVCSLTAPEGARKTIFRGWSQSMYIRASHTGHQG